MSNSTNILPALQRALVILPVVDRNMLIVLYVAGTLGSFLNLFTLLQKKFRKNPCSLYFLSASITDLLVMNGVLMVDALRYLNPLLFYNLYSTTAWCKLGKYFVYVLPCLSSTFITLACVDRFCTSSHLSLLRKLSQVKVSHALIPTIVLIWVLFSSHILILYDSIPYGRSKADDCRFPLELRTFILIVDGYVFCIYNGIVVPVFLCMFGLLIYVNVKRSRRRLIPAPHTDSSRTGAVGSNPKLNRQNVHLIVMVLVQSSLTVILNVPYMIIYLNSLYQNPPSSQLLLLVYYVFVYIARWFWFLNYVKTFYLNNLSSQMFRTALKEQLVHIGQQSMAKLRQWSDS